MFTMRSLSWSAAVLPVAIGLGPAGVAFGDETRHCKLQAEVAIQKQAEPHPPMQPGLVINYVLTASNSGATSSALRIVDDMTATLDDASIAAEPTVTAGTVVRAGDTYVWDLSLATGGAASMRYAVTIKSWDAMGDGRVRNAITAETQGLSARSCEIEEVLPPRGGADTGDGSTILFVAPVVATAAAAAVATLGGLVVMRRRRRMLA